MVVVLRANGLRIVIYKDDHHPAHVHVFGDGETKVQLGDTPDMIQLVYARGVRDQERRRVERLIRDNHALLLTRWNDLHG